MDGIETTDTSIPSSARTFEASMARATSEPVAIKVPSGVSLFVELTTPSRFTLHKLIPLDALELVRF